MCGRFVRFTPAQEFACLAGLPSVASPVDGTAPSWNIPPGTACLVVLRELGHEPALAMPIWGLIPHWAKQRPAARPINARFETAAEKQMTKRIFRFRRCLVAADGWYEWLPTPQGKQPFFLRFADRRPCFFGGLWNEWPGPDGTIATFTVLTRPAAANIAHLHERMPVIVRPEDYAAWLDKKVFEAADVHELCRPTDAGELLAYRVGTRVNRPDANGPELLTPVE